MQSVVHPMKAAMDLRFESQLRTVLARSESLRVGIHVKTRRQQSRKEEIDEP